MLEICGKHKRGKTEDVYVCPSQEQRKMRLWKLLFPEYLNSFLRIKTDTERLKQVKFFALLKDILYEGARTCCFPSVAQSF